MMTKDLQDNFPVEEAQRLIEQTLRMVVDNLHWTVCRIDADLLDDDARQKRLTCIERMAELIGKHAQSDLATTVRCEQCCRTVLEKLHQFTIH